MADRLPSLTIGVDYSRSAIIDWLERQGMDKSYATKIAEGLRPEQINEFSHDDAGFRSYLDDSMTYYRQLQMNQLSARDAGVVQAGEQNANRQAAPTSSSRSSSRSGGSSTPTGSLGSPSPYSSGGGSATSGGGGGGSVGAIAEDNSSISDPEGYLRAHYPDLLPYLQIPELVQKVLIPAAKNHWDSTEIIGSLEATDWWKNTPGPEREWFITEIAQPGTAALTRANAADTIRNEATKIGVNLTPDQVNALADRSLRAGWISANGLGDATALRYEIAREMTQANQNAGGLNASQQMDKLERDWGVKGTTDERLMFTRGIGLGNQTIQDYSALLQKRAEATFGSNKVLLSAIQAGVSPGQFFDPYAKLASQELGIPVDGMNWQDPKWMTAMNFQDPMGQSRPMNIDEWQRKIRTDPSYGWQHTSTADDLAAKMDRVLLNTFGAIA